MPDEAKNEIITVEAEETSLATPMDMIDRALTSGAGPDTIERLLALQERWEANQARKAFDAAMANLRRDMPEIVKRREVDFTTQKGRTNYKYEDLTSVTEALSPVMADHGLSFRWRTDTAQQGVVSVTCIISHRDGHSEETTLSAGHDQSGNKNFVQAIGSTVTYLQRYTLKAAVGVSASADTDTITLTRAEAKEFRESRMAQVTSHLRGNEGEGFNPDTVDGEAQQAFLDAEETGGDIPDAEPEDDGPEPDLADLIKALHKDLYSLQTKKALNTFYINNWKTDVEAMGGEEQTVLENLFTQHLDRVDGKITPENVAKYVKDLIAGMKESPNDNAQE